MGIKTEATPLAREKNCGQKKGRFSCIVTQFIRGANKRVAVQSLKLK